VTEGLRTDTGVLKPRAIDRQKTREVGGETSLPGGLTEHGEQEDGRGEEPGGDHLDGARDPRYGGETTTTTTTTTQSIRGRRDVPRGPCRLRI